MFRRHGPQLTSQDGQEDKNVKDRLVLAKTRRTFDTRRVGIVSVILWIMWLPRTLYDTLHESVQVPQSPGNNSKTNSDPAVQLTRIWPFQTHRHYDWCRPNDFDEWGSGLVYVKIPKAASSTLAGINIRMAAQLSQRLHSTTGGRRRKCPHTFHHGREEMVQRQPPYLLWSFVREPAARVVGQYYHFEVSRNDVNVSLAELRRYGQEHRNYQFRYLVDMPRPRQPKEPTRWLQKYILSRFDFLGVVERMEESLAVLAILWGIPLTDMLVLSSKVAGQYDDGRFQDRCYRIQKPPPQRWQHYFTHEFVRNNHDYLLYDSVNRSLDRTIQQLGVTRVQQQVQELQRLQQVVQEKCHDQAIFPCSNGTRQAVTNCYVYDLGCGYPCVDRLFAGDVQVVNL